MKTIVTGAASGIGRATAQLFADNPHDGRPADLLLVDRDAAGLERAGAELRATGVRVTLWIGYSGSWAAGWWVFFSPLRRQRDLEDHGTPGSGVPGQGGRERPGGAGPQLGD